MRVLIVSGQHFAAQPRKVDLHFIAEALNRRGVAVDFLSLRLSQLSRLIGDERYSYAKTRVRNRWSRVNPLQDEFIWLPSIHPVAFGRSWMNDFVTPLYRRIAATLPGPVRERLPCYSDILLESGIALLWLPTIRRYAPEARIVYNAADRLETIGAHPLAREMLLSCAGEMDLARLAAEAMRGEVPSHLPTLLLPHGLAREDFDAAGPSPYGSKRNAISVGDMLFDAHAVEVMARAFPDWDIHLFGRHARLDKALANVVAHGEQPFAEIVPWICHADLGIAPYLPGRGADYISQSSMKLIQYTYARLPIVAPAFAAAGRLHVSGYDPAEKASIRAAFARAAQFDRSRIDKSTILSWDEMAGRLFPNANQVQRTKSPAASVNAPFSVSAKSATPSPLVSPSTTVAPAAVR